MRISKLIAISCVIGCILGMMTGGALFGGIGAVLGGLIGIIVAGGFAHLLGYAASTVPNDSEKPKPS
ncbi:MAG: hypothetical protein KC609_19920 [Myxococcales bacterium]|nr:hypothetical protein [Myxococcales bacterium]